jgi:aspartate carbamoyltransferase catalytic subunit
MKCESLVSINDFSKEEIMDLLEKAKSFEERHLITYQ